VKAKKARYQKGSIKRVRLAHIAPAFYLRAVLARIAEQPINRIEKLLPRKIAASLQTGASRAA